MTYSQNLTGRQLDDESLCFCKLSVLFDDGRIEHTTHASAGSAGRHMQTWDDSVTDSWSLVPIK